MVFGDSYVAAGNRMRPGWGRIVAVLLGRRPILLGRGGTGFVRVGPDGRLPYGARLHELLAAPADIAIVQATGNDAVCDIAEVAVATEAFLREAANRFERLYVIGPMWALDGSERLPELRDATRDVCARVGVPFVDALGWLTARDIGPDGAHPTWAGHWKIARRAAGQIRRVRARGANQMTRSTRG